MSDKVFEQILYIRDTGLTNMFDTATVLRLAVEFEFDELVSWLPKHKKEYAHFILTGER